MIDHQLGRCQWLDLGGIPAELGDGLAHGGQIHDHRHTSEVLHHHARWSELDLFARLSTWVPVAKGCDGLPGDVGAVLIAQEVLQKNLVREREAITAGDGGDAVDLVVM